ncbi:MAG TPA: PA14 domain-containing protein [Candidatus Baltobacteraceae bacterium]|jgi:uncharacterized repeat protein (TIGR03806 family)|nr:PA14 domain-containing protein [Candidatus Baltobacteraceae bacterium]
MSKLSPLIAVLRYLRPICLVLWLVLFAGEAKAQTAFVNFNTVGEYTNNFNPWNDNAGVNGGNYSFEENTTNGVGGSGGVAVYQNNDMTAAYKSGSWNLSSNGATVLVSVLVYADGQTSDDKVQLGVMNSATNGLNSNPGVAFESFRFIPNSATSWNVYEQYRTNNTTVSGDSLGSVTVAPGTWYNFVVGVTNTSGASGNLAAGCALYDYGTSGLTPGANLITFSTAVSRAAQDIATNKAVRAALRAFEDGGISAWDNFLVFRSNSPPVITLAIVNTVVASNSAATFNTLADGPGTISYAWYTNNILAAGATGITYTTPPLGSGLTNVTVVARNANGSATNSATVSVVVPKLPEIESVPATNIQGTSATLGGEVLSTGGVTTTVTLYYGTTDGGTNAGAWAQDVPLGAQTGVFSQTVALATNTTYFFTVEASNADGVAWATPSRSFTTSNGVTALSFFGNGTNWTINQEGLADANITGNVFYGTDGNGGEGVTAWYDNLVYINGFVATFTYQDVGGSPGANADGSAFVLQESGPTYLGADGGALGISGLTPSADWEIDLYTGNGIGIVYNTDGNTFNYQTTGAVNVSSGDPVNFIITYSPGGAVLESLFDTVTQASFTTNYDIGDITALLGSSLAYVGFSSADGGVSSVQTISDFSFQTGSSSFTPAVVTNLPATAILPASATLAGQVLSTGGLPPTITLYYGPTDGGTNAGSWANSISVGLESASFSQTVTGLLPNTTYYYTAKAVNYGGTTWASPPEIFSTPGATVAEITNVAPANITANSTTLAADVTYTGGIVPAVTIFYGTTDGGTNAGSWASSISLGPESGYAAVTVPDLASNTTYYFTAQAGNNQGVAWSVPSFSFTTLASSPASTLIPMLTYHNDNARDGVNSNETHLTLANVNTNTFGQLFSYSVDGFVYAQPLVMTNVIIPGKGLHDVVYVATENDSVYAFDADSAEGPNINPLWQVSFIDPAAGITTVPSGNVGSSDITPTVGITATPVIDPASGTLYVEVKTMEVSGATTTYVHRLHALDITTGNERANFNSPVVIQCTNYPGAGGGDNDGENPPHVLWNPLRELSRPALTLLNGAVYLSYASHGDNGPYHGWLFAYNATNLSERAGVYNSTPNGGEGGFWEGGGGPSVDAQGNLYLQTGNGDFDQITNVTSSNNYAMSLIKFSTTNGLTMVDFFAPSNAVTLAGEDQDLGSSAPLILPDSAGSVVHPHLVVGGGKTSPIYLVDRDKMGRWRAGDDTQIVQQFNGGPGGDRDITPAFFNGTLYIIDSNSRIGGYGIANAIINTTPVESPDYYDNKGGVTPCISANGASNAIVWAIYNAGGESPATPAILRAYSATNLNQELYTSDQLPSRDSAGDAVKFVVPTIVNGKVYVGAQYTLTVYGLGAFLPTPVIQPDGGFFTNSVTVSFSDGKAGVSFYYTVDGTTPTIYSTLYAAPFTVSSSTIVQVIASADGAVSGVGTADFINSAAAGKGVGLVGAYYANQLGTFVAPPTLVRTDAVVNFNWSSVPPAPDIGPTNFSARWTGCVQPQYSEDYTFYTLSDAGARLWINGQLLINDWSNQSPAQASATIPMLAQQIYNIQMDYYYQDTGDAVAELSWSSPSTAFEVIPQSQLYPVTNPPPVVVMISPTNGAALTAAASVTLEADAAAQSNAVSEVAFYINGELFGTVTNAPYALTDTGLAAGDYSLTAVATDTTGLAATSAPVNITVKPGSGLPFGLTNYTVAPSFYNMPPVFTGTLPTLLSLTGVFTNTPAMAPVASLIPYTPNVPLWSDGAQKVRYFSIPNSGAPYTPAEQIAYAPTGTWSFPAGTVFVKTFELQTNQSDPTSLLRLETRLLVRNTNGSVYGVTYKWRSDYSDADLLYTNLTEAVAIQTPEGVVTQMWYYPSPSDCLQCHTAVANYVLGVNARQLNGDMTYPNGTTDNQLRAINRTGLFYPAIDESQIPNIEQLSSVTNPAASYVQRARSYLDANCAQCHQPGGTGPTFDARYDTPLTNQNIIGTPAVKGNLGYDNVDIVTPNDVWRSSLYDRMNIVNPTIQMPPLARLVIDTNAVNLMADWINSLGGTPALPPPVLTPAGGTYQGFVSITILPPTNNVTMYYTLDGSLPTTNSLPYTGPFTLTNSATVNANAWEPGYIESVVDAAQFTILPGIFFLSAGGFTNGSFQMSFAGPAGSNYVLQVSTNLIEWTSISTNTPATSPFVLSDPNAPGDSSRFYRVLQAQ